MTIDRHMGIALGGSVALHLLGAALAIVLLIWKGLSFSGGLHSTAPEPEPAVQEREVTLLLPDMTIVEKKAEQADARMETTREFVHNRKERGDMAPAAARFQSNRNSRAASVNDPTGGGDASLPAQDGKNLPFLALEDRDLRLKDNAGLKSPGDFEINILREDAHPPESGEESPHTLKNRIAGGAARGEEAAVDAAETPEARYRSEVRKHLRRAFIRNANARNVPPGVLSVHFNISRDGEIVDVRVAKNDAPPKLADAALDTVLNWTPPDMPVAVSAALKEGLFSVEVPIVVY